MAQIHNELRKGTLSEAIKRALGVTRSEGGVERFGETVTPIVHPWGLPEWAYLRGEALAGGQRFEAAAGATFLGSVALVNPAASKYLVVVTMATYQVAVAANVRVGLDTEAAIVAVLPTTTIGSFADTRWSRTGIGPIARIRSGAPAAALGSILCFDNTTTIDTRALSIGEEKIVLSPGFGIVLQNQDDNAGFTVAYAWRERLAYPGELA